MPVAKILLYYVFTPLPDPEAIRLWQRELCESLGLRGRILVSRDGINGTVGGELDACRRYVRRTKAYAPFRDVDMKWSEGSGLDADGGTLDFPRLTVRVRDEIVSFGAPGELRVDAQGVVGGGERIGPEQLHELVAAEPDLAFFDGRNRVEAEIGRFRDAIVPDTSTTRDFVAALDSGAYDDLKQRPVVTYCTGGVRCEVLSALMRERGFERVYQLDGGIVRYGERYGNDGLWDGALTVFDAREHITFGPDEAVLGRCRGCDAPTHRLRNCDDPACRERLVVCEGCDDDPAAVRCPRHVGAA